MVKIGGRSSVFRSSPSEITRALTVNNDLPKILPQKIIFSGGVSRYIYQRPVERLVGARRHVGPILAEAYKNGRAYKTFEVVPGAETIHATVMGAGIHTVNVSGSTVTVKKGLPADPEHSRRGTRRSKTGHYDWIDPSKTVSGFLTYVRRAGDFRCRISWTFKASTN